MDSITYYFNGNQSLIVSEYTSKGRRILWGWIWIVDISVWDDDFSKKKKFAEGVKQQNGGDFFFPYLEILEW